MIKLPNYIYRPAYSKKSMLGQETGHLNGIAYLWPGKTCFDPRPCYETCYAHHGHLKMNEKALRERSELYLKDQSTFIRLLERDIELHIAKAKFLGLKPSFRLNGTSDINTMELGIIEKYKEVQFYDYCKNFNRYSTFDNYYLLYSYNGVNAGDCIKKLRDGFNIAIVFDGPFPETWHGYPVINGEINDLRFLDRPGHVIALTPKGKLKKKEGIKWK